MSDEERPEDHEAPEGEETPDLPPPATFAGKARQADEQEDPPDEFAFDEEEADDGDAEFRRAPAPTAPHRHGEAPRVITLLTGGGEWPCET